MVMEFTSEIRKTTEPIYQKISKVLPEIEWSVHAPYVYRINQLKKENENLKISKAKNGKYYLPKGNYKVKIKSQTESFEIK